MFEPGLINPSDSPERQNEKLRRITKSLMDRIERDGDQTRNAFGLFQRAIALEGEVKARTADLQRTLEELNRVNEQLEAASAVAEEANRAKSRFLAAASHDVRQPLNAAKLYVESLAGTDLAPDQAAILKNLGNAFQSVENIIGSLLDISRLDSSAARAEPVPYPVAQLLDAMRNDFGKIADARNIEFRVLACRAWIESDPFYLRQIVQNLVSNALRYCGKGRVLLGCRRFGDRLSIQVHDSGPGIDKGDIPLIFQEFKRLGSTLPDTPGQEGVGLGLAIVQRACRLMNHDLTIESDRGRGTYFAVSVPIYADDPSVAGAGETTDGDSPEAMIILLLTRDDALAEEINGYLDHWGMGAITAETTAEAQTRVDQLGVVPDTVLVDARGARAEDVAALRDILGPFVRIVRISDRMDRDNADDASGAAVLQKPILPHRLRAALI
ncbi:MAG: HAMP domain-containing sensor histidine kinase [Pseudomonadota bacterium]